MRPSRLMVGGAVVFCGALLVAGVACRESAKRTEEPSVESQAVTGSSPTQLTASAFDVFLRQKVRWSQGPDSLTASFPDGAPYDVEVQGRLAPLQLEVYDRGSDPQRLLGKSDEKVAPRGEPVSWTVGDLPCKRPIEGEFWIAGAPRSGGYLVAIFYGETDACSPKPKPTPPTCQGECCPTEEEPNPCPTPSPSPSPSPTPSPSPCPDLAASSESPNPCPTPTPTPTPTPSPSPTPCPLGTLSGNGDDCEPPALCEQKQIRRRNIFTGQWGPWRNASHFEYATCLGHFCERRTIEVPCDEDDDDEDD